MGGEPSEDVLYLQEQRIPRLVDDMVRHLLQSKPRNDAVKQSISQWVSS
eukprot:NODE_7257_length_265_cov_191.893519_g6644_i0.p2 GENE.NODE_7257_length_265_cov_191.893519_g6644_i0~~NODE_7257_length_265_cov_191.893519_g6644_i0.p2  ORF type:complete len:59 (+),score=27.10 NODE_7257_length_265_cov_191.893519_g6644_i0:32-178(+)